MKNWGWGKLKQAFFFSSEDRSEVIADVCWILLLLEIEIFFTLSLSAFVLPHYVAHAFVLLNWRGSSHLSWNFKLPGTPTCKVISHFSLIVCLFENECRETSNLSLFGTWSWTWCSFLLFGLEGVLIWFNS